MPTQWQPDCLRLLVDITKELGEIKAFVLKREKWPVPSLEEMVEMLSILRGTNLDASLKYGYVETAGPGETFRTVEGKRFPCYEDAIRNIRESSPDMGDGPLEYLQELVEKELYSKGSAWYSLEEKRAEIVDMAEAGATLGDLDAYWTMTLNSLIKWHDINPMLGYQRPYAQAVR
tara:strand:+ start:2262 stop:2786 length:525 start_codon:yes stop_codon:yes gene_type:complete